MARSTSGDTEMPSDPPITAFVPPVSDGNEEFPVPFERFALMLHHTEDEVWVTHLRIKHGRENHRPSEWRVMLDSYRNHPAHPDHPDYRG